MTRNATIVNNKDNVATATNRLGTGEHIEAKTNLGLIKIELLDDIPRGHKFALKDIQKNEPIYKFGHVIGIACKNIRKGEHIHIHNIESTRGRGDKQ
jgi:altronate dehydratase small subunit